MRATIWAVLVVVLLQGCSGHGTLPPPDCRDVPADRQAGANCIHRPDF
jgi:hypothetical protein